MATNVVPTLRRARRGSRAASRGRICIVCLLGGGSAGAAAVDRPGRRLDTPSSGVMLVPGRTICQTTATSTRAGPFLRDPRCCLRWAIARYLHTMYRITDPEKSRTFYEALGLEFRRDMDIVRNGEKEATNYFFGVPGQEEELELTFNHDGRTYELGTGYGHVALAVDDLDDTLAQLKEQGIEPEREPDRVRGGSSRICFVRDPDSYRVELIDRAGK